MHFVCNLSALLDFDTEDVEMRNVLHDVRREVGLDDSFNNQSNAEIICIVFLSISTSRVCVKAMRVRRLQENASNIFEFR